MSRKKETCPCEETSAFTGSWISSPADAPRRSRVQILSIAWQGR